VLWGETRAEFSAGPAETGAGSGVRAARRRGGFATTPPEPAIYYVSSKHQRQMARATYTPMTHTDNRLTAFVRDNPGRSVPEETLTHSHPT